MVDLAWFSALAHLATLTSLRYFFRKRPMMATFRVVVMGLVLTLLSVAYVPTGYIPQISHNSYWDLEDLQHPYKNPHIYYKSMPTKCLYSASSKDAAFANYNIVTVPPGDEEYGSANFPLNVGLVSLSILFLMTSYGVRVVRIYRPLSQAFDMWMRVAPMNFLLKRYQIAKGKVPSPKFRILHQTYKVFLLTVLAIAEAFFEVGNSVFWELLWLSSAAIWGTLRLAGLRRTTPLSDEASWGFGQILALILCVIPILDFVRRFLEAKELSLPTVAVGAIAFQNQARQNCPCLQEVKKSAWYRSLTFLIMGTKIEFAVGTLFVFPAAEFTEWRMSINYIAGGPTLGYALLAYVVITATCLLLMFVYVSSCLVFHFRRKHRQQRTQSSAIPHGTTRTMCYKVLYTSAWCFLTLFLLALEALFVVMVVFNPNSYHYFAGNGVLKRNIPGSPELRPELKYVVAKG
ncbi:MAG: hypothetical protein Q9226_001156 [Calogaya cf. arnoldii]